MPQVAWTNRQVGEWYELDAKSFDGLDDVEGVYIIGSKTKSGRVVTVRVGQGNVKERLTEHRNDARVRAYEQLGMLVVTWAMVPETQIDGIETYVARQLQPQVGERFPNVAPVEVNLPAGWA